MALAPWLMLVVIRQATEVSRSTWLQVWLQPVSIMPPGAYNR
jgi:hypothetical protein